MIRNILSKRYFSTLRTLPKIRNQHGRCISTTIPTPTTTSKTINHDVANNRLHSPENGYYWKSGYEEISVPDLTLDEYVWKNVAKWENKVAIVCEF